MIDGIESVGRAYGEQAGSTILTRLNVNGGTYNGFLDTKEPTRGVEKLVDLTNTCVSDQKAFLSNTSQDWPMYGCHIFADLLFSRHQTSLFNKVIRELYLLSQSVTNNLYGRPLARKSTCRH